MKKKENLSAPIHQHDDYICIMSDRPEYALAYNITDMALTILKQASPCVPSSNKYDDNVFHAVLIVLRCLTEYPDIIPKLITSEEEICAFFVPLFQKHDRLYIPEFYHIDRQNRRKGKKPPALNDAGKHLLRLTHKLRRKGDFYKQLCKKLIRIHTIWYQASQPKTETIYNLDGEPLEYDFQFMQRHASRHSADLYSGATIEDVPILAKHIKYNNETDFMREWEAYDILHHSDLLKNDFFPDFFGVSPNNKTFYMKQYNPLSGIEVSKRKIINHSYSDEQLKNYIHDIYHATSLLLRHNIRHNDMHLCNLVMDDNKKLKIIDFGMLTQRLNLKYHHLGLMDYQRQYINEAENYKALGGEDFSFKILMEKINTINALLNNPAFLIMLFLKACRKKEKQAIKICHAILEQEKVLYTLHMALLSHKDGDIINADDVPYKGHHTINKIHNILRHKKTGWQKKLLNMAVDIASDIRQKWTSLKKPLQKDTSNYH